MGQEAAARVGPWAEQLVGWLTNVRDAVQPDAVVLCGSYARGTYVLEGSDVDVLVVGGSLPEAMHDRFLALSRLASGLDLPLEPIAYTRDEFENLLSKGHVGVYDALEFGLALLGDEAWAVWKQQFAALRGRGLRRTEHSWVMPPGGHKADWPGEAV